MQSAPGRSARPGTVSATDSGDGRERTSPMAPSSSWWVISTTVRRKFGSIRDGDETSSLPASESTGRRIANPARPERRSGAVPDALAVRTHHVPAIGVRDVTAGTAVEHLAHAVGGVENVISRAARERVPPLAAVEHVVTGATRDALVSELAEQLVVPRPARDPVRVVAHDPVVAGPARHGGASARVLDVVVVGRP